MSKQIHVKQLMDEVKAKYYDVLIKVKHKYPGICGDEVDSILECVESLRVDSDSDIEQCLHFLAVMLERKKTLIVYFIASNRIDFCLESIVINNSNYKKLFAEDLIKIAQCRLDTAKKGMEDSLISKEDELHI